MLTDMLCSHHGRNPSQTELLMAKKATFGQNMGPSSAEQTRDFDTSFHIQILAQACQNLSDQHLFLQVKSFEWVPDILISTDQICQEPHQQAGSL